MWDFGFTSLRVIRRTGSHTNYELHTMMRVDKSLNEIVVVDEVMRRCKNVIDGFHSPCLLVFDKNYFSSSPEGRFGSAP